MVEAQGTSSLSALLLGGLMASGLFTLISSEMLRLATRPDVHSIMTRLFVKIVLALLWLLGAAHISFFVYALSVFLITPQEQHNWSLTALLATTVIRDTLTRCLVAQRMLNDGEGRRLPSLFTAIFSLVIFLLGIVISFKDLYAASDTPLPSFQTFSAIAFVYLVLVLICDGSIGGIQIFQRCRDMRRNHDVVLEIASSASQVSSILAILTDLASIISVIVLPNTIVFSGIHCGVASLSTLALLYSLSSPSMSSSARSSARRSTSALIKKRDIKHLGPLPSPSFSIDKTRLDSPLPPLPPIVLPETPLSAAVFPSSILKNVRVRNDSIDSGTTAHADAQMVRELHIDSPGYSQFMVVPPPRSDSFYKVRSDVLKVPADPQTPRTPNTPGPTPRFTSLFARSPTPSTAESLSRATSRSHSRSREDSHSSSAEKQSTTGGVENDEGQDVFPDTPSPFSSAPHTGRSQSVAIGSAPVTVGHRLAKSMFIGSGISGITALLEIDGTIADSNNERSDARSIRTIRSFKSKSVSYARSVSSSSSSSRPSTAGSSKSHGGSMGSMEGWSRRGSVYDPELGDNHDYFKADGAQTTSSSSSHATGAFGPYRLSKYESSPA